MRHCLVLFCKHSDRNPKTTKAGITYFTLTSSRHDSWLTAIGRDPNIERLAKSNLICSEHFEKKDMIRKNNKLKLKKETIPKLKLGPRKPETKFRQSNFARKSDQITNSSEELQITRVESVKKKRKISSFSAPVKSQQGSSSSVDYTESRNVKFEDTSNNGFKNYQMKVEIEDPVLQCGITDYNLQQNEIADRGISPGNIYTSTRGIKRDDDEDDIFSETEVVQLNIKRSSIPKVENRTTEDFEFIPCSIMDEGPNSDAFIVEEGVEEKVDDQTEFDDFDVFMANLEEKLKKLPEHLIEEAKTNILSYVSTLELSSSNLS